MEKDHRKSEREMVTQRYRERDKKRGRETESQRPREKRDRERGERGWDRDG